MELNEKHGRKYEVSLADTAGHPSLLSMLTDPAHRRQLIRWVWLPCSLFSLGLVIAQAGPTLLDLEIITDTDTEMGSIYLTTVSGGYLVGSFLSGAVHGKINNNVVMATATLMSGALTMATPYCPHFVAMLCVRGLAGIFLGCIDCTVNAEHMRIWGTEGQGLLQFAHFSFAIGGVISPAFSAPFLAEKENETVSEAFVNVTCPPTVNGTWCHSSAVQRSTNVQYAYLITGIILSLTAIPFVVMLLFCKEPTSAQATEIEASGQRDLPLSVHVFLIAVVCVYYTSYVCIENTFSSFLETFVVKQYEVSEADGAYITTFYWAAFAAGRFTAIFVSDWLVAVRLLYVQFSIMAVAFTGFVVSSVYEQLNALKAFTCLIGLALSSVYPAGISWIEAEVMQVTGRIAGVILVGSSLGSTVNPYIVGYLMGEQSNLWFCYFLMGSVIVTMLLFLFLLFFNRLYVNSKHGKFHQSDTRDKHTNVQTKYPQT